MKFRFSSTEDAVVATVHSLLSSRVFNLRHFFAHCAARTSAKLLPGVRHIACKAFFPLLYLEFITVKDVANVKFSECKA